MNGIAFSCDSAGQCLGFPILWKAQTSSPFYGLLCCWPNACINRQTMTVPANDKTAINTFPFGTNQKHILVNKSCSLFGGFIMPIKWFSRGSSHQSHELVPTSEPQQQMHTKELGKLSDKGE